MRDVPAIVKEQAVAAYLAGLSASQVAARFGYGSAAIMEWVREAEQVPVVVAAEMQERQPAPLPVPPQEAPAPRATLPVHPAPEERKVALVAKRTVRPSAYEEERKRDRVQDALDRYIEEITALHRTLGLAPPRLP